MPSPESNYDGLKNNEAVTSDKNLQKLIKEIDELKNEDNSDDKIDNVLKD